jgi:hypothetical protein
MSQVNIGIDTTAEQKVVIFFDRSVEYLEFSPEQAIAFAKALVEKTMTLAPDSQIIIPH